MNQTAALIRQKNIQTILTSDVIARALILVNGTLHIISVYANSTNIEFFWVNKEGNKAVTFKKDSGFYNDFPSFIYYYANFHKGEIISSQVYSTSVLKDITIKPAHLSVCSDWTPRIQNTAPSNFQIVNKRLYRKIRATPMFWPGK